VEHTSSSITKQKIAMVAEELGIDDEYLQKKLREIGFYQ
jgi:hypothetical protein